jgi:hypothetical protein
MIPNITTILRRFTGEWAMLLQYDAVCIHSGLAMRSRLLPLSPISWTIPAPHPRAW